MFPFNQTRWRTLFKRKSPLFYLLLSVLTVLWLTVGSPLALSQALGTGDLQKNNRPMLRRMGKGRQDVPITSEWIDTRRFAHLTPDILFSGKPLGLKSAPLTSQDETQQVNQGRERYDQRDFTGAIALWTQALEHYSDQGDTLHQAMVLTYLCLAQQHLGQWSSAESAIQQSLALLNYGDSEDLELLLQASPSPFLLAQALNANGRLHLALGQAQRAATAWQRAADIYDALGDPAGATGSRVNQVEAIATLGHYRQACRLLVKTLASTGDCDITTDTDRAPLLTAIHHVSEPSIKILGLRTLGNLLRVVDQVDTSRQVLQTGLFLARQLPHTSEFWPIQQSLLLGLGETERTAFQQYIDRLDRSFQPRRQEQQSVETVRAQGAIALDYYRQAAQVSNPVSIASNARQNNRPLQNLTQRQAQAQELQLLLDLRDWLQVHNQDVTQESAAIQTLLEDLFPRDDEGRSPSRSPSHLSLYAQLNIAQSLMRLGLSSGNANDQQWTEKAIALAEQAVQGAGQIQDQRSHSYSLGILGHLWEKSEQWAIAQTTTQAALTIANQLRAEDLAYQWHWQLGRIADSQHQRQPAIEHYTLAFETLQSIRHDVVFLNPDVQFSFQDTVEPVYRELVDVLLRPEAVALKSQGSQRTLGFTPDSPNDQALQKARVVMDALQVAEVETFLGQACTDQELAIIDQVVDKADQTAALIYTIVLPDRLDVILKLPQRDRLLFHSVPIAEDEVEQTTAQLYALLQQKLPSRAKQAQQWSQQLYNGLIAPFEDALSEQDIQTLIFVLDGPLQTIPMATLFDGDRYLIESYAVATTPGLQLVSPSTSEGRSLDALLAGWITPPPASPLQALPGVATELDAIQQTLDRTEILTDNAFTRAALEEQINRRAVPIVHLATHGQFSSQSDQTFIATGDGDRLTLDQLGTLLQSRDQTRSNPIQLLFLSACQTLTGDKRAALGMAGLAVRSGARSTIASLWQADDEATAQLVSYFYQALAMDNRIQGHDSLTRSKAEALRLAQLELLHNPRFSLPVYWSPFVLLGDWL